jgi:hypothetical protein
MRITPHEYLLDQQRCLLLAVAGRCEPEEWQRLSYRVDRFAEFQMPEGVSSDLLLREHLRYGLRNCRGMLNALNRHFHAA